MGKNKDLKRGLKSFKARVQKDMGISRMILFGSRATGKPRSWSDVDLLIVSPDFAKLEFVKRAARMYDYWSMDYPVDFLCYSPQEFEILNKRVSIVRDAAREGIEI